ncbi:hypothetical protein SAMN05216327_11412 [Dyadobacter sp. SG02]|uniref:ApeA N-terminal domain 1-containing protein n=1 Tax=Dyadobacter sp. SG02 TaxID=1855291 RepID=UPI0008CADA9D|nr:hypothetical protein [Dyadobacter sp. SG02]SEJ60852.1 hypothetical protein SAMN05216327_11412 [Dyadobacter sp. SG02]
MTNTRKYKGKWFLVDFDVDNKPTRGSEAFDGVLKFDSFDGAVLTLRCRDIVSAKLTERVDVFLGETDKGQVTLYSCLNVGHGIGRGSTYRYTGDFVFEGGFLYDPSASLFSTLYSELHNLSEWVDKSTIKISRDEDNNVTIKIDKPDSLKIRIDDPTLLKLRFFSEGPEHTY